MDQCEEYTMAMPPPPADERIRSSSSGDRKIAAPIIEVIDLTGDLPY